jgi:hypothetical protein
LLMMEVVGIRSARHFVQRSLVVGFEARKDGGSGGDELVEELGEVEIVDADCVELRRRKGMLGSKYSGNGAVGAIVGDIDLRVSCDQMWLTL